MANQIRVNGDGTAVAIKRDLPSDHPLLWGIMTTDNGGHYGSEKEVEDWLQLPYSERS